MQEYKVHQWRGVKVPLFLKTKNQITMKLIIKLEVREGETSNTVVELEEVDDVHIMNAESLNNFADQYASEYYGCTTTEGKWHYTDDMCIAVAVYDVKEVSDEDFEVLKKYI